MTTQSAIAKLQTIFQSIFNDEGLSISIDTKADDLEAWDSLHHVLLVVEIENKFDLKLTAEQVEGMDSVSQILSYVVPDQ